MELVYLWVEDYKNIHHQGFNFSPRFTCRYDEVKQELTIDKKDDYVSIFPPNINITAIVGENGSGKSKLLNCFSSDKPVSCRGFIYFKENKLYSISRNGCKKIKLINNTNYQPEEQEQDYRNETFLAFNLSNELDGFNRGGDYIKYYDIDEKESKKELLKYLFIEKKDIHLDILPFYFYPDSLSISVSENYLKEIYSYFNYDSFTNFIKKELVDFYSDKGRSLDDDIVLLLFYIREMIEKNQNKLSKENKDYYWDFIEVCKNNLKTEENYPKTSIENKIQKIKNYDGNLVMPDEDFLRIKPFLRKYYFYTIDKLKEENVFDLLLNEKYFPLFDIDLADNNKERTFFILSSGEKYLYTFFIKLFKEVFESDKQDIIIMIDELENYLHPNWQKRIINLLISFLEKNFKNKKLHIIITSHSPYILSDIPKENVIFLKKGEDGNCKNVTKETNIETFGANIHTLLSHGFFMKDGLMGEFAKGKIRTIQVAYKYILHRNKQKSLNKKEHKKSRRFIKTQLKRLWYIQSIIGENFLRTIMKNYLQEIEQILLGNDKAIDNEIERLQKLKKSIKNASN